MLSAIREYKEEIIETVFEKSHFVLSPLTNKDLLPT